MDQLPPLGRSIWEVIPKTIEIYASLLNAKSKDVILATSYEDVEGNRVLNGIPSGLVYRNLGYYFAEKHGFETIIPDYWLVRHSGKYPSSADDIALVLAYTKMRFGDERPLFLLGNSAGGVNILSWLLDDTFWESCVKSKVTGLISLSALMDFDGVSAPLPDVLTQYFGKEYVSRSPLAQLRYLAQSGTLEGDLPALLLL
ncbi:hypothetical protein V496_00137 [Pseudogymnoascus sp. VKM F-4515 (FW-2607)]|nr:hypothetical protein V496_00137 [Pseudogymnoascus sp. VKM F-4515 (FW-2607)]